METNTARLYLQANRTNKAREFLKANRQSGQFTPEPADNTQPTFDNPLPVVDRSTLRREAIIGEPTEMTLERRPLTAVPGQASKVDAFLEGARASLPGASAGVENEMNQSDLARSVRSGDLSGAHTAGTVAGVVGQIALDPATLLSIGKAAPAVYRGSTLLRSEMKKPATFTGGKSIAANVGGALKKAGRAVTIGDDVAQTGERALTQPKIEPTSRTVALPEMTPDDARKLESAQTPKIEQSATMKVNPETLTRVKHGDVVDGLTVGERIPNQESIGASLDDYTEISGVRAIPLSEFDVRPPTFYSASEKERTMALADEIKMNERIDPLIVVYDGEGAYILEGGHRFDALKILGKKEFPAKIVIDESVIRIKPESRSAGEAAPSHAQSPVELPVEASPAAAKGVYDVRPGGKYLVKAPGKRSAQPHKLISIEEMPSGKVGIFESPRGQFTAPIDEVEVTPQMATQRERQQYINAIPKADRPEVYAKASEFDQLVKNSIQDVLPESELSGLASTQEGVSRVRDIFANSIGRKINWLNVKEKADLLPDLKVALSEGRLKSSGITAEWAPGELDEHLKAGGVFLEPKQLGSPARKALSEPMENQTGNNKLFRKQDVVNQVKKDFGITVLTGKSRGAMGTYSRHEEVIRQKTWGDLSNLTHELAHHIENKMLRGVGKTTPLGKVGTASGRDELIALGKELYGDKTPTGGYAAEGFAEFLAMRLTGSDTKIVAPKFTDYFEKVLAGNKDLRKKLDALQPQTTNWFQQGSYNRVLSQIDRGGLGSVKNKVAESIGAKDRYIARFKDLWVNSGATIEMVERTASGVKRINPSTRRPTESPSLLFQAFAGTASAKARSMVMDGVFDYAGNKTYRSLKEIIGPVSKDIKNWLVYAYGRRAVDLWKRDINPGISLADAEYQVSKLESPAFRKAVDEVTEWNDKVLDYLVDAGRINKDAKEAMRDLNPVYIPLKRSFEEQAATGTGKALANVPSPIKRIKGSGRPIIDPLESMIAQTTQIISTANRTRIFRALDDLAQNTPGLGSWIREVPVPKQAMKTTVDALKKQLEDAGLDVSDASLDQILTVYGNAPLGGAKDNVVVGWRNGEQFARELDPQLYKAVMQLDYVPQNLFLKFFGAPARFKRLFITGLNPAFSLVTNPIRDAMTFSIQSRYTKGTPVAIARGLYRKYQVNEISDLYKRSGVDMSASIGMDRNSLRRTVGDLLSNDKKSKAMNIVKHPVEVMRDILAFSESGPRRAEFEGAFKNLEKQYGNKADAFIGATVAAKDVTTDFTRAGHYAKYANALIPFFNASIQGADKFARTAASQPIKTGLWGLGVASATIGLWSLNKDQKWYRDLEPWEKAAFWHFEAGKNPDGTPRVVRVPRPFEYGLLFAGLPQATFDKWNAEYPEAINDWVKTSIEQVSPDVLPAAISPALEDAANYNFFLDRQIVPEYMKSKSPDSQYFKSTPQTYRKLGELLGWSPLRLQHSIEGYAGNLPTQIARSIENKGEAKQAADLPIAGRFFSRVNEDKRNRFIVQLDKSTPKEDRGTAWRQINEGKPITRTDDVPDDIKFERKIVVSEIDRLTKAGQQEKANRFRDNWNKVHGNTTYKIGAK